VTAAVAHRLPATEALAPVTAALRAMSAANHRPGAARGLAPDLLVPDESGWLSATRLTDGYGLADLLDSARGHWQASTHAAATLAWKSYSYWLALPAVLGWAAARRVPLLHPADVLVRFDADPPLTLGLRGSVVVAVLPSDPLARHPRPRIHVVGDEAGLLAALRGSLLDAHLAPALDAIQDRVSISTRTLLGSVSSGIAHGILRAAVALPGSPAEHIGTLLRALGIEDLIELVPGPGGSLTVHRRTCCLQFTLPKPKVCAGCCIRPWAARCR
jgi:hypothetical protein